MPGRSAAQLFDVREPTGALLVLVALLLVPLALAVSGAGASLGTVVFVGVPALFVGFLLASALRYYV